MEQNKPDLGNILFISEDADLTRMLNNAFKRAEFTFTSNSIQGAIAILEHQEIDLIIYDYQLSQIDSFTLLRNIKTRFPDVVRVILGGFVEQPGVVKTITDGLAMSSFTKPRDANANEMRKGLTRILSIRRILKGKKLLQLMNSIESLPHLPLLYQEFMKAVENRADYQQFSNIIEKDASVASAVLHVTNSAFYGNLGTASLEHAIMYLGIDAVRDIVLAVSLASHKPLSASQMEHFQRVIRHSAFVNKYMQYIYKLMHNESINSNYKSVGITHDIGKIVLLQYFPDRFDTVINCMKENPLLSFYECELSLGYAESTHAEIGAFLLDLWNLPDICIEVALFHHQIDKKDSRYTAVLEAAHLTNDIVSIIEKGVDINELNYTQFHMAHTFKDIFPQVISQIYQDYLKTS